MKAQDVEFVKSEARSIKTDGYAKRSKLPRKTANAIIVQNLSEDVDTGKPRSNYVNVLMEIGISRRSAYRLVGKAYKAKVAISDDAAHEPPRINATKALTVQSAAVDVRNAQSEEAAPPAIISAPRNILWPDEVKKAADSKILAPLEDIVTGAWHVGVMMSKHQIEIADYRTIMQPIGDNLAMHIGKFSDAALQKAFSSGLNGRKPPLNQLVNIPESPSMNDTGLDGKKASVFIQIKGGGNPTSTDPFARRQKEQEWRDLINAMVPKGDEVAAFTVDGERVTDRNGEVMRFDNLVQAMEFAKIDQGVAVVIHAQ